MLFGCKLNILIIVQDAIPNNYIHLIRKDVQTCVMTLIS